MNATNLRVSAHLISLIVLLSICSCLRYLTHDREEVLLKGVDIDQTLDIAGVVLQTPEKWGSVLSIWVIRDQFLTPAQADRISQLYFANIDSVKHDFNVWHFTWAIADIYRLGDDNVKAAIQSAYSDATRRAAQLGGSANKHANGEKLYMGDAHSGGRLYAKRHVVVPGNTQGYVRSYEEFLAKHKKGAR